MVRLLPTCTWTTDEHCRTRGVPPEAAGNPGGYAGYDAKQATRLRAEGGHKLERVCLKDGSLVSVCCSELRGHLLREKVLQAGVGWGGRGWERVGGRNMGRGVTCTEEPTPGQPWVPSQV